MIRDARILPDGEVIGYSCGITRKVTSDVVVKCEAYKRRCGVEVVEDD